jgi:hypothetical protein
MRLCVCAFMCLCDYAIMRSRRAITQLSRIVIFKWEEIMPKKQSIQNSTICVTHPNHLLKPKNKRFLKIFKVRFFSLLNIEIKENNMMVKEQIEMREYF